MEKNIEIIYLAGGCYWGLEHLINEISGVIHTEVGFSGGHIKNVCYKEVTKGDTGHAETVKVEYDCSILSLDNLLEEFFKIHNPTTINQQGNDMGSQYRSAIFYTNPHQKQIAEKMIQKINNSGKWGAAVVTALEQFVAFYPAEESHQKYLQRNPSGYTCHFKRDISFDL
jgi:peptide-methionine (S)-S-oxide reductase